MDADHHEDSLSDIRARSDPSGLSFSVLIATWSFFVETVENPAYKELIACERKFVMQC